MNRPSRKTLIVLSLVLLFSILSLQVAQAITFGQPDENRHPNVGTIVASMPDGGERRFGSGTLISPTVFLTAAHVTEFIASNGIAPDDVFVTFDPIWDDENATLYPGTYDLNPSFTFNMHDRHDLAVVILDEPVEGIEPAALPPAWLLSDMKADGSLKGQRFVAVGYGMLRDDKTKGSQSLYGAGERYFTEQSFLALRPYWLELSSNPSLDSGGACYGDSGGPHFLGDTNMIVSLTSQVDPTCRATDVTYRLDTDSARSYLEQFVTLP
jgi:hypothetical protein